MSRTRRNAAWWAGWAVLSALAGAYLALGLFTKEAGSKPVLAPVRALFLPGATTSGHYQIELACESCHTDPFAGRDALQDACVKCHGAALKEANDTHPLSKFTDPRNADRTAKLDATYCVTCHVEHRPRITDEMGVTVPQDFCFHCHSGENDITKERASHRGMGFDTCANAGCHNFHDNRALYEEFLLKHRTAPDLAVRPLLPARDYAKIVRELPSYPSSRYPLRPLTLADRDAPASLHADERLQQDWLATAHAKAGVNCSGCHEAAADGRTVWTERPGPQACAACHGAETQGFLSGKHGMRLAQHLPAMSPGAARLPMKAAARDRILSCTSCHGAHRFDTRAAAVTACLACHDDTHSAAYERSPHAGLARREQAGELPAGSGVTCAGCHLPRITHRTDDVKRTLVQHNQNDNLRPGEKMVRSVCLQCHGLRFALDALADPALVARNFSGQPARHVASMDMAERREREIEEKKRRGE